MSVDTRLLRHWRAEQTARRRARRSLPASWVRDGRSEMRDVTEVYVESIVAMRRVTTPPAPRES